MRVADTKALSKKEQDRLNRLKRHERDLMAKSSLVNPTPILTPNHPSVDTRFDMTLSTSSDSSGGSGKAVLDISTAPKHKDEDTSIGFSLSQQLKRQADLDQLEVEAAVEIDKKKSDTENEITLVKAKADAEVSIEKEKNKGLELQLQIIKAQQQLKRSNEMVRLRQFEAAYAGGKRMKAALPNIEVMQSEAELEVDEDDSYTYILKRQPWAVYNS